MVEFPKKPDNAEEWTTPINFLDGATVSEKMDYYRANAKRTASLLRRFPDALDAFVGTFGQDFADEIASLAV